MLISESKEVALLVSVRHAYQQLRRPCRTTMLGLDVHSSTLRCSKLTQDVSRERNLVFKKPEKDRSIAEDEPLLVKPLNL